MPAAAPSLDGAPDDYDIVRERLRAGYIGSRTVDPADRTVVEYVTRYGQSCDEALVRFAPGSDRVFVDLPLLGSEDARPIVTTLTRLRAMAYAHAAPGGRHAGSAELAGQLVAGLRAVHEIVYHAGQTEYDHWWSWEIGAPTRITTILVLCHEIVPDDLRAALADAIAHFIPDPGWIRPPGDPRRRPSTGGNRSDLCRHVISEGVLMRRPERIAQATQAFLPTLEFGDAGDGLLSDGSFIQHRQVAYTGAYGAVFLSGATAIISLLAQTQWQIKDPRVDNLLRGLEHGYLPWVFDGQLAASLRGRAVSYPDHGDSDAGISVLTNTLKLARQADPETAARWRGLALGWVERSTHRDIRATASLPLLALIEEAESMAPPIQSQPVECRTFPGMDRVVHQRPGWAVNIAIASNRTNKFEVINRENRNPWHQGDGFRGLYLAGEPTAQFDDHYWPTVDPYRLPGTTIDSFPLRALNGGKLDWYRGAHPMVGGCVVGGQPDPPAQRGRYGLWTARESNWESSMQATLSWFFLEDGVVCLGAGLSRGSAHPLETVLENRKVPSDSIPPWVLDGRIIAGSDEPGWRDTLTGTALLLPGTAAYLMLDGPRSIELRCEERTGDWHRIRDREDDTPFTRTYQTAWLDHGVRPGDASYAYQLLPRIAAADLTSVADAPNAVVVENRAALQAVAAPRQGFLGAAFHEPGAVQHEAGTIITSAPSTIATALLPGGTNAFEISVADPARSVECIDVEVALPPGVVWQVARADDTVRTQIRGGAARLAVWTADTSGRSQRVLLAST